MNSAATPTPVQSASNLTALILEGDARATGDEVLLIAENGDGYAVAAPDDVLGLAQNWNSSEFNIFGDGGGSEAFFNNGSTLVARQSIITGDETAPSCAPGGFTAEKNSLYLVPPCCTENVSGNYPAIVFTESSSQNAKSMCACLWDPRIAQCVPHITR